ncbi:hypothetical protein JKP88DRAFT_318504 [Tribonema minus]|uniref:Arginine kinase n=1 Tax=Tribonema minus TaxID=303371 RepID=A0A835YVR9_9STRA|nr:hypothetical protein JKP88DRAFT_318504 [Tribonema minus]
MGAGASAELSPEALKAKYADVKCKLYSEQQEKIERMMSDGASTAEIIAAVDACLNDPQVPNAAYAVLPAFTAKHKSLMARALTPKLFDELRGVATAAAGYTLSRAIQTGVMSPALDIGCTAGDEESWTAFRALYAPVVRAWHGFDPDTQQHRAAAEAATAAAAAPASAVSDAAAAALAGCVTAAHVRGARNLRGYPLPAGATAADRAAVRAAMERVLARCAGGDCALLRGGALRALRDLSDGEREALTRAACLPPRPAPGSTMWHAGAARDWPDERGVYFNNDAAPGAAVWVNYKDHCCMMSVDEGGDLCAAHARYRQITLALESAVVAEGLELMRTDALGHLTSCPSMIGTAMHACLTLRLPKFNHSFESRVVLTQLCAYVGLQQRYLGADDLFELCNKQTVGAQEGELVQRVIDGCARVVAIERELESGAISLAEVGATFDTPAAAARPRRRSSLPGPCPAARKSSVNLEGAAAAARERRASAASAAAAGMRGSSGGGGGGDGAKRKSSAGSAAAAAAAAGAARRASGGDAATLRPLAEDQKEGMRSGGESSDMAAAPAPAAAAAAAASPRRKSSSSAASSPPAARRSSAGSPPAAATAAAAAGDAHLVPRRSFLPAIPRKSSSNGADAAAAAASATAAAAAASDGSPVRRKSSVALGTAAFRRPTADAVPPASPPAEAAAAAAAAGGAASPPPQRKSSAGQAGTPAVRRPTAEAVPPMSPPPPAAAAAATEAAAPTAAEAPAAAAASPPPQRKSSAGSPGGAARISSPERRKSSVTAAAAGSPGSRRGSKLPAAEGVAAAGVPPPPQAAVHDGAAA